MKKFSLILMAAMIMVGFAACNDKKAEAPTQEETVEVTIVEEEVVAPAEQKKPEEVLKEFEKFVKDYADANNNKLKDIKKYQQLAQQSQRWTQDIERVKAEFNDKQLKRYEKASKSLIEINSPK